MLASAFLETVHNPCKQSELTGRRVGTREEGSERVRRSRTRVGAARDRFKQDYQTIKRISTFPGVPGISSSFTLCAEHPRGNFEEDPGERRTADDEEDFARA